MNLFMFGTLLLVVALVAAFTATTSYTLLIAGQRTALSWGRWSVRIAAVSILVASLLLLALFYFGRYEFDYVYNYSSNDLELRYKLSALWAGQQGSFMIWALVGLLAAPLLLRRSREFEPFVLMPLMAVQVAIISFMLINNPFALRFDVAKQIIYAEDGRGLNELLHNPWMVIHPPILFLGYGLLAIPFAYAIAGLWRRDYDGWVKAALPWTITAWVVLTTALTLGGYWAYETLGWGGYWAWDPVENSSLLPWLTVTALLHGMLVQRAHGGLRRANFSLAIVTYGLVMYASFLTRSGVLGDFSVHSFTEDGLGTTMAAVLVVGLVVSLGIFFQRWRDVPISKLSESLFSRDSLFVLGMFCLVIITLIVGLGTSMPLFSKTPILRDGLRTTFAKAFDIAASQDGRFSLQPSFFRTVTPPFGLVVIGLMTMAPLLGWRGGNIRKFIFALRLPAILAVVATVVGLLLGVRKPLSLAYLGLGSLGLGVNILMIVRTVRGGWMRIGGYAAHIGAALLVIGFVGSSAYSSPDINMTIPLNTTQTAFGHKITFEGYATRTNNQGAEKGVIDLAVQRGDGEVQDAAPQLYLNPRDGQWISNPAIIREWWGDLYISPGKYLAASDPNLLTLAQGQKGSVGPYSFVFQNFDYSLPEDHTGAEAQTDEITIKARLTFYDEAGKATTIEPGLRAVANVGNQPEPYTLADGNQVLISALSLENRQVQLQIVGLDLPVLPERADIFVSTKPAVGLVWVGTVVMTLGGSLAATRRFIEHATKRHAQASVPEAATQAA
ncbi:cytochrome c biogenesis protein CcsA [Herpetosiphon gulosus]|uniref:Cytochrome c-type biogenesis protein CcmF n=1 Tax=Herpetosiphon gulosus TaxID=1973496 RepID=A0ABP9X1R2_9CHLR